MGFSLDVSVPVLTVFVQGLLSFFSPCVLPLIPLYMGYLSGGTGVLGEDGKMHFKRSKVMGHTLCFVLGVSFAFFLLGLGFSAVGTFFKANQMLFARIGGIFVVFFGLYQLGVLGTSRILGNERRLPFKLNVLAMSPVTALLMGFTFSFAWTPCVGPALASVLLMAASASTKAMGFVLIGVYTAGFVLPFLAVGLFTTTLLEFFKSHMKMVKYTVKAGGILMVLMGFLMFTGKMNAVTGYLSSLTESGMESKTEANVKEEEASQETAEDAAEENMKDQGNTKEQRNTKDQGNTEDQENTRDQENTKDRENTEAQENTELPPAIDFTLQDQYGNTHTLSEYKGKTVFLNFWGTWCPPCRREMPDIQELYETYEQEGEEALVVLGIAAPGLGQEKSEEEIKSFLEENGYTYPVVMDTTGEIFTAYGITSFPTTFMIDRDGNVFGYASGQLNGDTMKSIIQQTMEGKRN